MSSPSNGLVAALGALSPFSPILPASPPTPSPAPVPRSSTDSLFCCTSALVLRALFSGILGAGPPRLLDIEALRLGVVPSCGALRTRGTVSGASSVDAPAAAEAGAIAEAADTIAWMDAAAASGDAEGGGELGGVVLALGGALTGGAGSSPSSLFDGEAASLRRLRFDAARRGGRGGTGEGVRAPLRCDEAREDGRAASCAVGPERDVGARRSGSAMSGLGCKGVKEVAETGEGAADTAGDGGSGVWTARAGRGGKGLAERPVHTEV